jgi:fatty acid amide hydrolase
MRLIEYAAEHPWRIGVTLASGYVAGKFMLPLLVNSIVAKVRGTRCRRLVDEYWRNMAFIPQYISEMEQSRIRSLSLVELVEEIREGKLTSETVVRLYLNLALLAHQETNCLTQLLADSAISEAQAADRYLKETGRVLGPLHGLPFSVKESFHLNGTASTMGLAQYMSQMVDDDAGLVIVMRELGAIPFCKTNVAQLLMGFESSNPIFGRVSNPWNLSRTAGGSSGGESALVAAGASLLGLGTDIGGSVRMPAAFCGIVGFKQTSTMIPRNGMRSALAGQPWVPGTPGLFTRSISDLYYVHAAVSHALSHRYPRSCPAPFVSLSPSDPTSLDAVLSASSASSASSSVDGKGGALTKAKAKLSTPPPTRPVRVGILPASDYFSLSPAVAACMDAYIAYLTFQASLPSPTLEVVKLPTNALPLATCFPAWLAMSQADGGEVYERLLRREEVDGIIAPLYRAQKVPFIFIRLFLVLTSRVLGWKRWSDAVYQLKPSSMANAYKMNVAKELQKRNVASIFEENRLDVILMPTQAMAAMHHRTTAGFTGSIAYANIWNYLDFPALSMPIGLTEDGPQLSNGQSRIRENMRDIWDYMAAREEKDDGNLPVGLQVVGLPCHEDSVVAAALVLESLGHPVPPLPFVRG